MCIELNEDYCIIPCKLGDRLYCSCALMKVLRSCPHNHSIYYTYFGEEFAIINKSKIIEEIYIANTIEQEHLLYIKNLNLIRQFDSFGMNSFDMYSFGMCSFGSFEYDYLLQHLEEFPIQTWEREKPAEIMEVHYDIELIYT